MQIHELYCMPFANASLSHVSLLGTLISSSTFQFPFIFHCIRPYARRPEDNRVIERNLDLTPLLLIYLYHSTNVL